jgi:hypothetical protein
MKSVDGNPSALEAAGQLVGKENVRKLGFAVTAPTMDTEIPEIEACPQVGRGGYVDDPGRSPRFQQIKEEIREKEIREVIQSKRHLDAIGTDLPSQEQASRIVDEHIQARIALAIFLSKTSHFFL